MYERSVPSSVLARELGISTATVQRLARDGAVPFSVTPGGHRRFNVTEVRTMLERPLSESPRPIVMDTVYGYLGDADVRIAVRAVTGHGKTNGESVISTADVRKLRECLANRIAEIVIDNEHGRLEILSVVIEEAL